MQLIKPETSSSARNIRSKSGEDLFIELTAALKKQINTESLKSKKYAFILLHHQTVLSARAVKSGQMKHFKPGRVTSNRGCISLNVLFSRFLTFIQVLTEM